MLATLRPGQVYAAADVVPHQGRMRLIDEIEAYGPDWVRVRLVVRDDGLWGDPARVPAWLGIEYMAQAAMAWSGIEQRQRGGVPGIGLLLGGRRYQCDVDHIPVGWRLSVTARLTLSGDDNLAVFDCAIEHNGGVLAAGDIKAYRPEDVERFLQRDA